MKDLKINSINDLKNEGKSFYWASFFLPKEQKIIAGNLYSICRYFDNIADKDSEDKSEFLEDSIENIKNDKKNIVNIFLHKNHINNSIFIDLLEGLIIDQNKTLIKNKKELIKYSYHVAGTVGLMMSKIIGVKNKKAASCAIDLGIAMQLTNIARDVFEDAQMQRIYIPQEWIPEIDLPMLSGNTKISFYQEKIITNGIYNLIDLAEKFYSNGFSGMNYIPLKARLGIYVAANIYRGIGTKIKKSGNKSLRNRIYLNIFEKIYITLITLLSFIVLPFLNYKYVKIRDKLPNENL